MKKQSPKTTPTQTPKQTRKPEASNRAVIYARRSSSAGKEESVSVAAQIEEAKRHCKANGWEVAGVFSDEGVSGSLLPRQIHSGRKFREGLSDALSLIEAGKAGVIVAYRLDRLSRMSTKNGLALFDWIEKAGAKVSLTSETIPEATTATGEFSLSILLSVSALYRRLASERAKQTKAFAKEEGRKIGRSPFGYRGGAKEQERLVRLFTDYAGGKTINALTHELNEEVSGFLGGRWHPNTVKKILRNPTYIGKWPDLSPNKAYAPIVPESLYWKVQKILDANGKTRARAGRVYPVGGLMFCATCGVRMVTGRTAYALRQNGEMKTYFYYRCFHSKICKTPQLPESEINRLCRDIVNSYQKTETGEYSAENAQLERIEKNIEDLGQKVASGELDATTFLSLKAAAEMNKKKIGGQIKTLKAKTETERKQVEWDKLSDAEKRLAIHERVKRIEVSGPQKKGAEAGQIKVTYKQGWVAANPWQGVEGEKDGTPLQIRHVKEPAGVYPLRKLERGWRLEEKPLLRDFLGRAFELDDEAGTIEGLEELGDGEED